MLRGLYTGQSAMIAKWNQLNTIANNLANINTTAYKKEETNFKSFPEMLIRKIDDNGVVKMPLGSYDTAPIVGKIGTGVELNEVYTKFEQGNLKKTNNDFDFALSGRGFFVIKTPTGEKYTRNGSFTINKNSFLVTQEGYYVQGEKGNIRIKKNNFKVDETGKFTENIKYNSKNFSDFSQKQSNKFEHEKTIDKIRIVRFYNERKLEKVGSSYYQANKYSESPIEMKIGNGRPKLIQGYLETSNVNPIIEMTKMIEVQRSYEASQKVIKSHDQLLGKAVNEIARI